MSELYTEKYRPKTVDECILPDVVKKQIKGMIDTKSMTHLLLSGSSGTGKTTLGKAICNELGCDYIMYNGSDGTLNIDELRQNVSNFAQTVNLDGGSGYKVIIIDEADGLSKAIQGALRNAMEKYSNGCRFILTCNYPDKIIAPLQSRCSKIDFKFNPSESVALLRGFAYRVMEILKKENIEHDVDGISYVCKEYFPDNRRILNEIQRYVNYNGKLDKGIINTIQDNVNDLFNYINNKEYRSIRQWVQNNSISSIYNIMYNKMEGRIPDDKLPLFIYCLGEGQKYHDSVPNQGLNFEACIYSYIEQAGE